MLGCDRLYDIDDLKHLGEVLRGEAGEEPSQVGGLQLVWGRLDKNE